MCIIIPRITLALILLCYTLSGCASTSSDAIDRILANAPNVDIGIQVRSMSDGRVRYQKNADRFFTPASVLKLFTATAAMRALGPAFSFHTTISSNGRNMVLHFSGDPSLTHGDLSNMITTLATSGVHSIPGNLYIDDTQFDHVYYGPGWMWDELNFAYAAPLSAIILDENSFSFRLKPGPHDNDPTQLLDLPTHARTPIINAVITCTTTTPCPLDLAVSMHNVFHLTGCLPPHSPTKTLKVAIRNMQQYTAELLGTLLAAHNITLHGKIIMGLPPHRPSRPYHTLITHHSAPLYQLLVPLLKNSDNLIADALYKTLGAHYFHTAGTWKNGGQAVIQILEAAPIHLAHAHIVDGAGMSRFNLITPTMIAQLLDYVYHDPVMLQKLIPALPIAGKDGTLKTRLKNPPTYRRVRAKTGTMTGGSTLAGFVTNTHHQVLSFVIAINGFPEHATRYQKLEDQIVTALATAP